MGFQHNYMYVTSLQKHFGSFDFSKELKDKNAKIHEINPNMIYPLLFKTSSLFNI